MQISEFIEATSRIEQYYDKEYSNEQRQIMFDELKNLDIERYKKLVSVVLHNCKFLPKLSDFFAAEKETPYGQGLNENIEKIDCNKCNGTGYIVYIKLENDGERKIPYSFGALCTCGNAKQYKGWEVKDKRYMSDFYTPTIEELGLMN